MPLPSSISEPEPSRRAPERERAGSRAVFDEVAREPPCAPSGGIDATPKSNDEDVCRQLSLLATSVCVD